MWELGAGAVALGLIVYAYFENREKDDKLRMRKLPLAKSISETKENRPVRVCGRLELVTGGTLEAPLSGRPCAVWRVIVQEIDPQSGQLVPFVDDSQAVDFLLTDPSGRARVTGDVENLVTLLSLDHSHAAGPTTSVVEAFLEGRLPGNAEWMPANVVAYEGILGENELVTVAGRGRFENDPAAQQGYRGSASILRMETLEDGTLLVTDDPSLGNQKL